MILFVYKGGLSMLAIQEVIRPSADLRNHYNEISRQCREEKEAVIITVNGRGDTVSLSYEEYKRMKSRIELLEILAEAEDDIHHGRTAPVSDTFSDLRAMLQGER
jgi:prevent-host-death family protein